MLDAEGSFGDTVGGGSRWWVGYNHPVLEGLIFLFSIQCAVGISSCYCDLGEEKSHFNIVDTALPWSAKSPELCTAGQ